MATLSFEHLHIGRSKELVLFEANGVLSSGVHLMMAPNGKGKSTWIQTIAGVLPALSGEMMITRDQPGESVEPFLLNGEQDVFFLPEYLQMPSHIYPHEWISFATDQKLTRNACSAVAEAFHMRPLMDRFIGTMSQGERRRVAWMAASLSKHRQVVLLDEPFDGLDLVGIESARNQLSLWKNEGRIVLVVTHQAGEWLDLVDSLLLIRNKALEISPWKTQTTLGQLRDLLKAIYL